MQFLKIKPDSAPYALQALTMVARAATNGLGQPQRAMLDATQRLVLESDLDIDSLPTTTPEELVSKIEDPALRRQLIRLMVATSLADGPPSMDQISLMDDFAKALEVTEHSIGVVRHMAKGKLLRFRLAFARRSHVRSYFKNTYRITGGALGVIKAILRFRGVLREDKEMAGRFHALHKLPKNTLGYHFYQHCSEADIGFAGEKGGFPIGAVFHDFAHLLGGYDTSPEGEMKTAAFQCGFLKGDNDDFFTMLFAIVIHTAGVNLAPFPMPVNLGRVGEGTLALEMLHAWQRGAAMKVDLASEWDFWEDVERPIDEVRDRLGVPPKDASLIAA